jgi:hypothetical protein
MSEQWARQRTIVRIEAWKIGPGGGVQWVPYDVMTIGVGEREKDWRSRDDERGQFRWFAVRVDPTSADTAFGFFSF